MRGAKAPHPKGEDRPGDVRTKYHEFCWDEALGATRQGRPLSTADRGLELDTFAAGYRRAELAILASWQAKELLAAPRFGPHPE